MKPKNSEHIDLNNPEFQTLWKIIQDTHRSVFLTGKAGTGKSTFLKYICAHTKKQYVVLAPTGIAAVNVGGQTLHSFFKIPLKPLLPDDPDYTQNNRLRKMLRYNKEKERLIQKLELIIIDEISMVRADIVDFIDRVLRVYSCNMREPFGGKQLLLVGDVFQLEPVVTRDAKEILGRYYKNFYFFDALAFRQIELVPIELQKNYRQTDNDFVSLLDKIRVNQATARDLALLNNQYEDNYSEQQDDFVITLGTRRETVDAINDEHLRALKTPEYVYHGTIEGEFPSNSLPTSQQLVLKEGAQIIFIRNDRDWRWCNGSLGKVSRLMEDRILVQLEDDIEVTVEAEQWENVRYKYNEKKKQVEETVLGTFTQFPIKPAWAITVHKSQGLTFNKVVIDFAGGAFASGQTYVALSRCTSLNGITLLKPLSERDIFVNPAVVTFSQRFNDVALIKDAIMQEKANSLYRQAILEYEHDNFQKAVLVFAQAMEIRDELQVPSSQRLISNKLSKVKRLTQKIADQQRIIDTQAEQLQALALEYVTLGNQAIEEKGRDEIGESYVTYQSANKLENDYFQDIIIKSALANYNKALQILPTCIDAMIGKARLFININDLNSAEEQIKEAINIDKNSFIALLEMGKLLLHKQHVNEAINYLKKAAKADKKHPEPHENLHHIYDALGLDDLADNELKILTRLRKQLNTPKRTKGRK